MKCVFGGGGWGCVASTRRQKNIAKIAQFHGKNADLPTEKITLPKTYSQWERKMQGKEKFRGRSHRLATKHQQAWILRATNLSFMFFFPFSLQIGAQTTWITSIVQAPISTARTPVSCVILRYFLYNFLRICLVVKQFVDQTELLRVPVKML